MFWGSPNRNGRDNPEYQAERTAQMIQFFQRYLQAYRDYTSDLNNQFRQSWQEQYDYIQKLEDESEKLRQTLLHRTISKLSSAASRLRLIPQYMLLGIKAPPKVAIAGAFAARKRWFTESYSVGSRLGIMFVHSDIGSPTRYRVTHQQEQLNLRGIANEAYGQTDLQALDALRRHQILYLYRVSASRMVLWLIRLARLAGIPVIFDTDDIVWGEEVLDYCHVSDHFSPREIDQLRRSLYSTKRVMQSVDYFVVSTDYLAGLIRSEFGKRVWVNENAFSQELRGLSEPFYSQRAARDSRSGGVVLGYFSGWPKIHQEDFESIAEPLFRVLSNRPHVRLEVFGYLDVSEFLKRFPGRIRQIPFVEWRQLPELISTVDVNLAPIVDNPHRRSKSAIKYIEASLVGVPTVATDLEPYRSIRHGQTGFLAANGEQWYRALSQLVDSPELRKAMGIAAHDAVVQNDSTAARSVNLGRILQEVLEIHHG